MNTKRLERETIRRKSNRLSTFDDSRDLPKCEVPDPMSERQEEVECKRMQLKKWKEEKERRKKEAAARKKKPFVAGIVHPPLKYVPPPPPRPMPSISGKVYQSSRTKSQTAQNTKGSKATKPLYSFAPSNASFKPPELKNVTKLPTLARVQNKRKKIDITFDPVEPDLSQKKGLLQPKTSNGLSTKSDTMASKVKSSNSRPKVKDKSIKEEYPQTSIQEKKSTEILLKGNNKTRRESGSEERLRSPKASSIEEQQTPLKPLTNTPMTPEQIIVVQKISPCVTLSRGKDSPTNEKKKIEEGLLNDVISDMEKVAYFRGQLDSEVKRITQMCETWDRISQQVLLSESALEMVLCAVGQARLLVSQKLAQFGSLVAACERPDPTIGLVTPTDLQGFWDLVHMQVENVDMRFKKLEELRARNWIEETPVIQKKRVPKTAKINSKPTATSRLRDLIAGRHWHVVEPCCSYIMVVASMGQLNQGMTTLSQNTSVKWQLNASVFYMDSTSLAMLRALKIGRSLNKDDTALEAIEKSQVPLIQINLMATPGRSTLKSINVASTQRMGKKSIKIVLFNNSDGENSFSQSPEAIEKVAEGNVDSGLSSMDVEEETDQNKENVKQKLVRQNAFEGRSPVLTRSRRKSET